LKKYLGIAALALTAGTSMAGAAEMVKYKVTPNTNWSAQTHPLDYLGGTHFSSFVGASHGKGYTVFADGKTASDGLEILAETGKGTPLDTEITKAISDGTAGTLTKSGAVFNFPGEVSTEFTAAAQFPMVSLAAMVAPSPAWITGVSNVSLQQDGKWVDTIILPLLAWDAGTYAGTTYLAADDNTLSRLSVQLNAAPHFADPRGVNNVGTVTFTRLALEAS